MIFNLKYIFPILCLLTLSANSCTNTGESEIIVAPSGFTGRMLIIFNQKHGAPVEYYGNARVYQIPRDGILKTQF